MEELLQARTGKALSIISLALFLATLSFLIITEEFAYSYNDESIFNDVVSQYIVLLLPLVGVLCSIIDVAFLEKKTTTGAVRSLTALIFNSLLSIFILQFYYLY